MKSRAECAEDQKWAVEREPLIWFENGIRCRNVTVENVYRNERNLKTKAPTVRIDSDVQAENLVIKNICHLDGAQALDSVENNSKNAHLFL